MESAHHFFMPDLIATILQDIPSFTLRTALSAIQFVSDLCGVDLQRFQERSSQDFGQIPRNCQCKWTLGFPFGSKNFCKLLSVS